MVWYVQKHLTKELKNRSFSEIIHKLEVWTKKGLAIHPQLSNKTTTFTQTIMQLENDKNLVKIHFVLE